MRVVESTPMTASRYPATYSRLPRADRRRLVVVAFLVWAKVRRSWPFAPVEVHEAYLEAQDHGGPESVQPAAVTA